MTTEEHIAELERNADHALCDLGWTEGPEDALIAIAHELRALRLMLHDRLTFQSQAMQLETTQMREMLKNEIREAAWTVRKDTLAFAAEAGLQAYPKEALASRKATADSEAWRKAHDLSHGDD